MIKEPDLKAEAVKDAAHPNVVEKCYDILGEAKETFEIGNIKDPYIRVIDLSGTSFGGCVIRMWDGVKMLLSINQINFCRMIDPYSVIRLTIWHELAHVVMVSKGDHAAGKHSHARAYADLCNSWTKKLGFTGQRCRSMRTWKRKDFHEKNIHPCDEFPFFLYPEIARESRAIQQRVIESKLTAIKPQYTVDASHLKNCLEGIKTLDDTLMSKDIPFRAHQAFKDVCDYLRATGLNIQTESELWKTMLLKGKKIGQVEHPVVILQSITDKINAEQMEVRKAIDELIGGQA
jgi:hypothetical protein